MGRVIQTTFGSDGLVRVVKLKTQGGTITRAITKICPLPLEKSSDLINPEKCSENSSNKHKKDHIDNKYIPIKSVNSFLAIKSVLMNETNTSTKGFVQQNI